MYNGIAKAAGTTVGKIVLCNILYDLTTFCTSIITRDKSGRLWHTRNLDYGGSIISNITKLLRDITVQVDFQRNGTTVYSGLTFVSYVGLLTAQKPNVFTVTVDSRRGGGLWMNVLVAILDHKLQPMSFVVRNVLESALTFREAVLQLSDIVTMSDVYYIVGGRGSEEGVVISKGRLTYDNLWWLKPLPGRWYLVETNYDHWKPAGDPRRQMAIKLVKKMGQNITKSALFDVISTPPVLNQRTVYQIVMSAARPDLITARIASYDAPTERSDALTDAVLRWKSIRP